MIRRRLGPALAAIVLLDWSLPFGFLNRLFQNHRWFPTNLTRLFAGALASPSDLGAILVVSASAPRFWTMGGLLAWGAVLAFRGRRRTRSAVAPSLWAGQAALFLSAELFLPWMGEKGAIPARLADALFPVVARGHGRAYEWLHLPALLLFVLLIRRKRAAPVVDSPRPFL